MNKLKHTPPGNTVGANVRRIRERLGMSTPELQVASGVASIRLIETGHRTNPTLHVLLSLAKGLRVPVEELIYTPRQYKANLAKIRGAVSA